MNETIYYNVVHILINKLPDIIAAQMLRKRRWHFVAWQLAFHKVSCV